MLAAIPSIEVVIFKDVSSKPVTIEYPSNTLPPVELIETFKFCTPDFSRYFIEL